MTALRDWWRDRRRWLRWKLAHPRGRYGDYYVERVSRRLDAGEEHVSLGAKAGGSGYEEAGRVVLERLVADGLTPEQRVVDYGCGSLRIGRHLIAYLAAERYLGLDLTDRFWKAGLETIERDLIAAKSPRFATIDDSLLERERADPPDVVVSIGVVIHVPRRELAGYLDGCLGLVGPRTRAYLSFFHAPAHRRLSEMTWSWPGEELVRAVEQRGLDADHGPLEGWPLAADRQAHLLVVRGRG